MEKLAKENRSSLGVWSLSDEEKSFFEIDTWLNGLKMRKHFIGILVRHFYLNSFLS
jgi:hypothetical protein